MVENIDDENKGKYRTTNVIISGAEHKPPQSFESTKPNARVYKKLQ